MSRVLVTGMSGTGKSSALAELGRRGFRVVDTDDPGWREYREHVDSSDEMHRGEWLWVEERMTALLDSDDGRSLFVQGCVRNQSTFYDRFDAVVLLSAPADVILGRIARRTTNNYGKTPVERAMILDDLARVEPLLRASCTHELDASRPLDEVVADLIAIASRPPGMNVSLRPLEDGDLDTIFQQVTDRESIRMAAFTAEDWSDRRAFLDRMSRLRADSSLWHRVIEVDGAVAGTIGSFRIDDRREVTYWVDRAQWGKGIASAALQLLLAEIAERPIYARAASDNLSSLRVLEKAGFQPVGVDRGFAPGRNEEIEETILRLD